MSGAENLPFPVWSGSFRLGEIDVHCHVLNNGQRIIEAESVMAIFGPDGLVKASEPEIMDFARWQKAPA